MPMIAFGAQGLVVDVELSLFLTTRKRKFRQTLTTLIGDFDSDWQKAEDHNEII